MDHINLQEREFHSTKLIKVPLERVFNAWIDPTMLMKWWGPKDVSITRCEVDPRPEGEIYIQMQGPDGKSSPVIGSIYQINPSSSLIFNSTALNDKGEILMACLNTVSFSFEGEETLLEVSVQVLKAASEAKDKLDSLEEGWKQSLARLQKVLVDPALNDLN